jgi:tRNA threonylcarbamoyladenosine biosynthesis protein TsaE
MHPYVYHADEEAATDRLGAALEQLLPEQSLVALRGTLGAGKTRLVQAIGEAAGIERAGIVSPTFVLIQQYQGRRPIYHFDAYRVRDEDEFLQLGPEEYFQSPGLTLVEWADRVEACLPPERVEVQIEVTGERSRRFTIRALGPRYAGLTAGLTARLGPSAPGATGSASVC